LCSITPEISCTTPENHLSVLRKSPFEMLLNFPAADKKLIQEWTGALGGRLQLQMDA